MSAQRLFFATAVDLRPGLERLEEAVPVRYVETGLFGSRVPHEFATGASLPNLGFATSGDPNHEPAFLVMNRASVPAVRKIPQRTGATRYAIDQLANPDSTVLRPCGLHGEVLIAGSIATRGTTPAAIELHRFVVRAVTEGFRRVRAFWVGPDAFARFQAGARLTPSLQMSPEYDLRMEDAG